jgi:hypothetical protein
VRHEPEFAKKMRRVYEQMNTFRDRVGRGVCPYCEGAVEGELPNVEGLKVTQECMCVECESKWLEVFVYEQIIRLEGGAS